MFSTPRQNLLAEHISQEVYHDKALEIQNEKVTLRKQIADLELKSKNIISTLEPTKEIFLRASRAKKEFIDGDDSQKRNILETYCWNLFIKGRNINTASLKSPYDIMLKADKNAPIEMLSGHWDSNPESYVPET